jgi:hypothetical protein
MEDERIKEIYGDSHRRVVISRRDSGTFYYFEEYFSTHPYELCWIPRSGHHIGFYETAERAESEARSNVDWLRREKTDC